jgi:hypothetical protein
VSLGWIWPRITDNTSARNAVVGGFWACIFISVVDTVMGVYALAAHRKVFGYYDAWVLVDGALFAMVAWRLWKNARAWAVIGVLLMALEIGDKIQNAASTFNVITILLFLAILNAARGTFALHQYKAAEASLKIVAQDIANPPASQDKA